MVLKKERTNNDILIIDASKGFTKEGKNNKLRASDIKKIADTVAKRESIAKFSRVVTKEEIKNNDYNLNIPRYVDSSEKAESWDIYASMFGGIPMSEIDELKEYWEAFPNLKDTIFTNNNSPYVNLATSNIKDSIKNHSDILNFYDTFKNAFSDFDSYLKSEWIENVASVDIQKEENKVSEDIFARLKNIPLVDKYEAYELLDSVWQSISVDLEIIQTEGFEATKKVDPNLVIKKKDSKEQEVQEGYIGHIMPFELIQKELLCSYYDSLKLKENRLSEIPSLYEEIFDNLTEDEKEYDILNDNGDSIDSKKALAKLKELKKDKSEDVKLFVKKLADYEKLTIEEKDLRKEIKQDTASLHMLTKDTIENLADSTVKDLLAKKWITSLMNNINKLPDNIINNLVSKLEALNTKYATTYFNLEDEIKQTQDSLCKMIDELEGNEHDMLGLAELKKLLS